MLRCQFGDMSAFLTKERHAKEKIDCETLKEARENLKRRPSNGLESIAIMSMSGLQLRDARASDRDAIEAVTPVEFPGIRRLEVQPPGRLPEGMLAALAAVQPATQIVAAQNSEIIGSVLLYPMGTVIAIPGSAPITLSGPRRDS